MATRCPVVRALVAMMIGALTACEPLPGGGLVDASVDAPGFVAPPPKPTAHILLTFGADRHVAPKSVQSHLRRTVDSQATN